MGGPLRIWLTFALRARFVHKLSTSVLLMFYLGAGLKSRYLGVRRHARKAERTPMDRPYLMSIIEAANALRISRSKTYELMNSAELRTVTIGRRRLVTVESVQALARGEAA
jgi:excisionase family DNA binding protein